MRALWPILRMALRATVWRSTPDAPALGLFAVVLWLVASLALTIGYEFFMAEAGARFSLQGLTALAGFFTLSSLVAAFFVSPESRATFVCAGIAVGTIAQIVLGGVAIAGPSLGPEIVGWWRRAWLPTTAVYLVWFAGAQYALLQSLEPRVRWRQLGRSVGLMAASLAVYALFPHYPAFVDKQFELSKANLWEYARATLLYAESQESTARPDRAQIELTQSALIDAAVGSLQPQVKGRTDIYALGIAGWAEQDVFLKELDGAFNAIAQVLPVSGPALRLVNHQDTVAEAPIATRQNFAAAVRAIGKVMDKDEDVLLLFMTSHGYTPGVSLYFPGIVNAWITPKDVAVVLDREGIKNRVVIVSACYAGVFVAPLANDDSFVITAADDNSVSFGCSNEREWTYFGEAFFNQSLKRGVDLQAAFASAKATIVQWETRDGLSASNPTAHFGQALVDKLASVYIRNNAAALEQAADGDFTSGSAQISQ